MYLLKSYKKVMYTAAAMLCITLSAVAAKPYPAKYNYNAGSSDGGWYLQLGGGYSFGAGKGYPAQSYSETRPESGPESVTESNASFSLGKGVNTVLGLGYMLNENIGLELNAGYLIGGDNTVENSSKSSYSSYDYSSSRTYVFKLSGLELTPALRLAAPIGSSSSCFYSRVGVIVPIFSTMVNEYDRKETQKPKSGTSMSGSEHKRQEYTSYFKLGYAAALGIDLSLGEHCSIFAEVSAAVRSFELKKGTITEWKTTDPNGNVTDRLATMEAKDKETEYLKELKYDSNTDTDGKDISYSMPASSVGVTIGLIIKF